MTKNDLGSRLSLVKEYLKILKRFGKVTEKKLESDIALRLAVERALFLCAQATIDASESFLNYRHERKSSSMHETFHILREEEVIDQELCERLLQMVGFRNVLTHGYSKINYSLVSKALFSSYKDIEALIKIFEKLI